MEDSSKYILRFDGRDYHPEDRIEIKGWVESIRDYGTFLFFDLRNYKSSFKIQCVLKGSEVVKKFQEEISIESLISTSGILLASKASSRDRAKINGFEIRVEDYSLLAPAAKLPAKDIKEIALSEELSLKYRYLYLRNIEKNKLLHYRSSLVENLRNFFYRNGFIEVATPILSKDSKEGSRTFLVESGEGKDTWYSLVQSPQIYKQALIASGLSRYFQFARCFRNEDLRSDRQPEFDQLDFELSFPTIEGIIKIVEEALTSAITTLVPLGTLGDIPLSIDPYNFSFSSITYKEAMENFGNDSPDIRYNLYSYFDREHLLGLLRLPLGKEEISSKELQDLSLNLEEIETIKLKKRSELSELPKWINRIEQQDHILEIVFRRKEIAGEIEKYYFDLIKKIQRRVIELLEKKREKDNRSFLWVTDFPMFLPDQNGGITFGRHPFTLPKLEKNRESLLDLSREEIIEISSFSYDLVFLGREILSGSLRINNPILQKEVFQVGGLSEKDIEEGFGFFIEMLSFSVPPHGGAAMGVERFLQQMFGVASMKEVLAFPKTGTGRCLFLNCPTEKRRK